MDSIEIDVDGESDNQAVLELMRGERFFDEESGKMINGLGQTVAD